MAKQSGLHQLKGKVDGYSYYRQSGVKAGLMRRINEGLSSRVKTSEEFANTRLNNSEFGNAADVAKVLASVIVPKFRPMFLNFSQAKLTKSLLSLIKQATGDWGQRALAATDVQAICDGVNLLAKNDFFTYCESITLSAGQAEGEAIIDVDFSDDNAAVLASYGADGVDIKITSLAAYLGQYSVADKRYIKSFATTIEPDSKEFPVADMPGSYSTNLSASAASVPDTAKINVLLVILMPYRTINGKKHTLQEKCTFRMSPAVINQGA